MSYMRLSVTALSLEFSSQFPLLQAVRAARVTMAKHRVTVLIRLLIELLV